MRIFLTGGTGFIGSQLAQLLVEQGHQLTILTRQTQLSSSQAVEFCHSLANFTHLDEFDAVINLAGEPIFAKRWTKTQKARLWDSRIQLTEQLTQLIQQSHNPPHTFLSGSATGYYGDLPLFAKDCDESTACGTQFPAQLCQAWENAALKAQSPQTRVCLLRTGLVFSPTGGALKAMLPLYQAGLGGKLGSGKQHWAWIALADYLQAVIFLLNNANLSGAFNFNAPKATSNQTVNHWLANQYHRPAFCTVPTCALQLALGERSQLLLDNQPLVPHNLLAAGFQFQYPTLSSYSLKK